MTGPDWREQEMTVKQGDWVPAREALHRQRWLILVAIGLAAICLWLWKRERASQALAAENLKMYFRAAAAPAAFEPVTVAGVPALFDRMTGDYYMLSLPGSVVRVRYTTGERETIPIRDVPAVIGKRDVFDEVQAAQSTNR